MNWEVSEEEEMKHSTAAEEEGKKNILIFNLQLNSSFFPISMLNSQS